MKIVLHHLGHELSERIFRVPSENPPRSGRIPDEYVDFGWPRETLVEDHVAAMIEPGLAKCKLTELPHRVCFACRDHEILTLLLLQHQMNRSHVVGGMSPDALCIERSQAQFLRRSGLDLCDRAGDFAGDV